MQGLVCWVLTMSLALCSSWLSQAHDVRHQGRHGPQDSVEVHRCSSWARSLTCPLVCYEWRHGPNSAENCWAIPQVQLIITVIFITVVAQRCTGLWTLLGNDFCNGFRMQHPLVRQWTHIRSQSTVAFGKIGTRFRGRFSRLGSHLEI